jgi:septal ring factor EnvC (AmiA/AmiB activator)
MSDTQDTRIDVGGGFVPPPRYQPDVQVVQSPPAPPVNPLRTPLVVVSVLAGVLLLVSTVGLGLYAMERGNHADTRATLASVRDDLAKVEDDLAASKDEVANLTSEVSTLESQLNGAQNRAQSAEADADAKESVVADLRTCLNGVLDSQDYLLDENYAAATTALGGVMGVCKSALNEADNLGI